jgi:predicted ribosome quality control (RQC) complex YloA/Tae2 family protein
MLRNYFTLYHAAMELHQRLAGGHLTEIFSEHKNQVTLGFITPGGQHMQLVVVTHTPLLCLYTREGEKRKARDSASLMSNLSQQSVMEVAISPTDREIHILFADEATLVLQLFSSKTNLFLVRENRITDAFKHKSTLIGQPYQSAHDLPGVLRELETFAMNKALFLERYNALNDESIAESIADRLSSTIPGLDRRLAHEVVKRAGNNETPETLFTAFHSLFFELLDPQPKVWEKEDGEPVFTILGNSLAPGRSFDSVLEGLAHYSISMLRFLQTGEELKGMRAKLLRQLEKKRKALDGFNPKLLETFVLNYEQCGHLLMAALYQPRTERKSITVENFFEPGTPDKVIPLKEALTLQKNAEEYFSKASKTREKVRIMEKRHLLLQQEKDALEVLLAATESISSPREARRFLEQQSAYPGKSGKSDAPALKNIRTAPLFRTVNLSPAITLLVGKNATNNDLLTFSHTKPNDIWLHARGASGSHCVLKGTTLNNLTAIRQAAEVAAWYSSAKNSKLVPVIYTLKKFVRRGKKLSPGQVIVEREEVLLVKPSNRLFSDPA